MLLSSESLDPLWGPPSLIFKRILEGKAAISWSWQLKSPPNTQVRHEWSFASSPPICLRGMDCDNFAIIFAFNHVLWYGNPSPQFKPSNDPMRTEMCATFVSNLLVLPVPHFLHVFVKTIMIMPMMMIMIQSTTTTTTTTTTTITPKQAYVALRGPED
jgi:hypothetical protein